MGFIAILPSNSSDKYFSDNHPTNYKVHLPKEIVFEGKYEVALLEISYPHNFHNIIDQKIEISYTIGRVTYVHTLDVTDGYFPTIDSLIEWMNVLLNGKGSIPSSVKNAISFRCKENSNLCKIQISRNRNRITVTLTKGLCILMGFDIDDDVYSKNFSESTTSEYPADVFRGLHSMYIYTDIIERQIVGDSLVPLLRICGIDNDNNGKNVSVKFNNPRYLPLSRTNISSIHINLRNEYGINLPFRAGNVIVTLEFRKSYE